MVFRSRIFWLLMLPEEQDFSHFSSFWPFNPARTCSKHTVWTFFSICPKKNKQLGETLCKCHFSGEASSQEFPIREAFSVTSVDVPPAASSNTAHKMDHVIPSTTCMHTIFATYNINLTHRTTHYMLHILLPSDGNHTFCLFGPQKIYTH